MPGLCDKQSFWLREHYPWEQSEEGNAVRLFEALLILPAVKAALNINFRNYITTDLLNVLASI